MKKLWGSTAMIIATILWGISFSAQSSGMRFVEPMLFTAFRSAVAVAALIAVIMIFDMVKFKRLTLWGDAADAEAKKNLLMGGMWCGIVITAASVFQQFGLKYTSAGKTGFLTALYIVIVPVIGLFFKRKSSWILWLAVALALAGSWLLCGGIGSVGKGEIFVCKLIFRIAIIAPAVIVNIPQCICKKCLFRHFILYFK